MTTTNLDGTDMIGQIVRYTGSVTAIQGERCVVVAYNPRQGRYTIEPIALHSDRRHQRAEFVRRVSLIRLGDTYPVCECGHIVRPNLPTNHECIRCACVTHRDRLTVPTNEQLTDEQLFEKVATGRETIVRDQSGRPIAVTVPFTDYLEDRAAAAFHGV